MLGFVAFLLLLFSVLVMLFVHKYREKIKKILNKTYEDMMFNGIIRSITLAYIKFAIAFGFQVELLLKLKRERTTLDMIIGAIMFTMLLGYLIVCVLVIKKYKATLETKKVSSKISNLYHDIRLSEKSNWNLMYYPIFLFRRIVFVAIPTFLHMYNYF
jgi:hypothetical protein